MTENTIRAGIIGAGGFTRSVALPGFAMAPSIEVVAIHDRLPEAAQMAADAFPGLRVVASLEEFLALDLDLVYISLPPGYLYEMGLKVIEAGKHFLIEKPTGSGSKDVADLLQRAEAKGLVHGVDHEMRFGAVYRKMRDLIAEGYVGEIRQASFACFVDYGVRPDVPTFYRSFATLRSHSGGVLRQLGSHYIDLFHYMMGPIEVKGGYTTTMIKQRPPVPEIITRYLGDGDDYWTVAQKLLAKAEQEGTMQPVDADDHAAMLGSLANGAPMSFTIGWSTHHATGVRWDIFGSEGSLRFHSRFNEWGGDLLGGKPGQPMQRIELPPEFNPELTMEDPRHMSQCFAMEVEDIARAIRGDRTNLRFCTLADELAMWKDIEEMEELTGRG